MLRDRNPTGNVLLCGTEKARGPAGSSRQVLKLLPSPCLHHPPPWLHSQAGYPLMVAGWLPLLQIAAQQPWQFQPVLTLSNSSTPNLGFESYSPELGHMVTSEPSTVFRVSQYFPEYKHGYPTPMGWREALREREFPSWLSG